MQRAVIYARFSSSRQREESIEGQVKECKAFAEYQGYEITKVYADRAISGRTADRPEFQQMIEDSKEKNFQYVIVYTFDRFSRDSYASAMYKHRLKLNGVRVLSAKERTDDSPAGVLMERVFEGFAEYYSLELAQKVKRGMALNASKGIWPSGAAPFGYKKDDQGRLVQNPEQIPALIKVFEMAAQDYQLKEIADYLNMQGFRSPNARGRGIFNYERVKTILKNPIAAGRFVWNDIAIEDYNNCQVISKELFEAVQGRLHIKRRVGTKTVGNTSNYALSRKIYCGNCGRPMNGSSGTSHNKNTYYYYRCSSLHHCDMPNISRDALEEAIADKIIDILSDETVVRTIASQAIATIKSEEDPALNNMQQRHAQAKKELKNICDAIAAVGVSDALSERLTSLQSEIKKLEEQIAIRSAENKRPVITEDMIVFYLQNMRFEDKQQLLDKMVQRVVVTKKDGDVDYNVTVMLNYTSTATCSNAFSYDLSKVREQAEMVGPVGFEPTTSRL
jgi:site-specific DNA recombinase